mmetsp:Transcript_106874/g.335170  ORF Transcript_106874/g.335170 Transcript_106874/m.335170 type:complete len:222 (+) Transcript_106874:121-786(+)
MRSWPEVSRSILACSCLPHCSISDFISTRAFSYSAFQSAKAFCASSWVSKTPKRYFRPKASMASDLYSLSAVPQLWFHWPGTFAGTSESCASTSSSRGGRGFSVYLGSSSQISFSTSALVLPGMSFCERKKSFMVSTSCSISSRAEMYLSERCAMTRAAISGYLSFLTASTSASVLFWAHSSRLSFMTLDKVWIWFTRTCGTGSSMFSPMGGMPCFTHSSM